MAFGFLGTDEAFISMRPLGTLVFKSNLLVYFKNLFILQIGSTGFYKEVLYSKIRMAMFPKIITQKGYLRCSGNPTNVPRIYVFYLLKLLFSYLLLWGVIMEKCQYVMIL